MELIFKKLFTVKIERKSKDFLSLTGSILFLAILLLMLPAVSFAGLVPCGGTGQSPCDFKGLMTLVYTLIRFTLYDLAVPIAAIMFFYAGFLMIVPGGESGSARTKAKNIFTNAVLGLLAAAAAFLVVRTLLAILGYEGGWIGFFPL